MSKHLVKGLNDVKYNYFSNYQFTKNPSDLLEYGTLFLDSEKYILNRVECAEYFLHLCKSGDLMITDNNLIELIIKLYNKIKTSFHFSKLKHLFIETMEFIEKNYHIVTNNEEILDEDDCSDLGWYYSVSPYCYLVNAMAIVRHRAMSEYVLAMAKHLKKFPDIDNLWGGNYLLISNIKVWGIKKWLGDIKHDHGEYPICTFKKIKTDLYRFEINNLGPANFIYMHNAYKNIADVLSRYLEADVEFITWLDD